jgi:hypothetical protein
MSITPEVKEARLSPELYLLMAFSISVLRT